MKKNRISLAVIVFIFVLFTCVAVIFTGCLTPLIDLHIGSDDKEEDKEEEAAAVEEKAEDEDYKLEDKKESPMLTLDGFNDAITRLVEDITPSVVNIQVTVKQEDIFGNIREGEGIGSGIIYSSDGYIITNSHVAARAEELLVTLYDGTEYEAELVGENEETDIAVIKIVADNLKEASFTSIEKVRVGEIAIAVGSPFGLTQTVTTGVVSAKGRDISAYADTIPMVDLVQTDAAINQGNSGGPLLNAAGQVIGINTIILSPSGANVGIGFAIPADTAVNIARQIIEYGEARIPFIGIEMGENTTDIVGVYVAGVMKGYPADNAGIKNGDIITEFNGKEIRDPYELLAQLLRHNPGDTVSLKIYRDGDYIVKDVELIEKPSS
jgi:serine protease Do